MTFTESFRMERVYFEKLKSNITDIKNLLAAGNTEDARILLENSVDLDGAVLLLYRNLGECWAELADQIKKTRDELDALKEATEAYHDELNEKIDEVNFVLLRLINALDARLTIVENDLATMPRVKFLSLVYDETESAYSIQNADGETVPFEDVSEMAEFPHFIVLTDADGNYYMPEEYTESGFVWHIDNYNTSVDAYSDITVLLATDDSVTVSESTLPKLSAGNGININSDDEIEVDFDAVQEKLIAGQNITLTPDATDPTKTVIDAAGANYSAGGGIEISQTDKISTSLFSFTGTNPELIEKHPVSIAADNSTLCQLYDLQETLGSWTGADLKTALQNTKAITFAATIGTGSNIVLGSGTDYVEIAMYEIPKIDLMDGTLNTVIANCLSELYTYHPGFNGIGENSTRKNTSMVATVILHGIPELLERLVDDKTYTFRVETKICLKKNGKIATFADPLTLPDTIKNCFPTRSFRLRHYDYS